MGKRDMLITLMGKRDMLITISTCLMG